MSSNTQIQGNFVRESSAPLRGTWAVILPPEGLRATPIVIQQGLSGETLGGHRLEALEASDVSLFTLRQLKPDGIIGVGPTGARLAARLGLLARVPHRIAVDPVPFGHGAAPRPSVFTRLAIHMVLTSSVAAERAAAAGGFPEAHSARLPVLTTRHTSPWRQRATSASSPEALLVSPTAPLRRTGDIDLMLRAAEVLRHRTAPDALRIVLPVQSTSLWWAKEEIRRRGLSQMIAPSECLPAFQSSEEPCIAVGLGPVNYRGGIIEALAGGHVVIGVHGAPGVHWLDHEVTGLVVSSDGGESLAEAIYTMLADPTRALALAEAGQKEAETLSERSGIESLEAALSHVLEEHRPQPVQALAAAQRAELGDPIARDVLGIRIHDVTMDECVALVRGFIAEGGPHQIATPNVNFLMRAVRDPEFGQVLARARLNIPDGAWVVRTARVLGIPLRDKVQGRVLAERIIEAAAQEGWRIFFLGAGPGVAERAAARMCERYPGLNVAGTLAPHYDPEGSTEDAIAVVDAVRGTRPDVILVAFGMPKQDIWGHRHLRDTGASVCIGIGGTFDLLAGDLKPAPDWVVRVGMEFVYRVAQEPRRLFMRYLRDASIMGHVARARLKPASRNRKISDLHAGSGFDRRGREQRASAPD